MATLPKLVWDGAWRSLWSTSVRFMNDREEYAIGARAILDVAKTRGAFRPEIDAALKKRDPTIVASGVDVYATSFSARQDELGQWRGYWDDGKGVSLVTSVQGLHDLCQDDKVAGWVLYGEAHHRTFSQSLLDALNAGTLGVEEVFATLQFAATFLKHEGSESEEEFRFARVARPDSRFKIRASQRRLVPYLDPLDAPDEADKRSLSLARVILGPGWQLSSLEERYRAGHHVTLGVRRLLDLEGFGPLEVRSSAILYDPS